MPMISICLWNVNKVGMIWEWENLQRLTCEVV